MLTAKGNDGSFFTLPEKVSPAMLSLFKAAQPLLLSVLWVRVGP